MNNKQNENINSLFFSPAVIIHCYIEKPHFLSPDISQQRELKLTIVDYLYPCNLIVNFLTFAVYWSLSGLLNDDCSLFLFSRYF